MKAAVYNGAESLEVLEVPTPSPGVGEALVRVVGCGMCHTDLHYLDHGVKTFKEPPIILGHEAAGIVAQLGDGTDETAVGDRVLIPAVLSCGRCRYCRGGRENLCDNLVMPGNNFDGAYAEFVVIPTSQLVPVPDTIPLERACVIADAMSTPYHAVKHRGRVRPGDVVAVVGCGGVGLNVVQCATVAGARVIAIDVNETRLEIAKDLGAVMTIVPQSGRASRQACSVAHRWRGGHRVRGDRKPEDHPQRLQFVAPWGPSLCHRLFRGRSDLVCCEAHVLRTRGGWGSRLWRRGVS